MRRCFPTIRQGSFLCLTSLMTNGRDTSRNSAACVVVISPGCGCNKPFRALSTAASSAGDTSSGTPLTNTSIRWCAFVVAFGSLRVLATRFRLCFFAMASLTLSTTDTIIKLYRPDETYSTDETNDATVTAGWISQRKATATHTSSRRRSQHPSTTGRGSLMRGWPTSGHASAAIRRGSSWMTVERASTKDAANNVLPTHQRFLPPITVRTPR
jgi:hypothetical protein